MPNFNIIKRTNIKRTYRVARIMADFDVSESHVCEHFVGEIVLPKEWNVGLICGSSGTGKSTIANELFGDCLYHVTDEQYTHESVIDDMPQICSVDEIEKMFYSVGFGSVPSWLKPYKVLSIGEKMRVDIAYALLSNNFVVYDEFTSVVDRNVAQVASMAISKAVKRTNKQFIAISCHKDIINWLQPDWIFDTDIMQMVFLQAHDFSEDLKSENVGVMNGGNLGVIII